MSTDLLPLPTIDQDRCTGCNLCVERCPTGALELAGKKAALAQTQACVWCSQCEDVCPTEAIGLPYRIWFNP